jgi:hypothetical protein
MARAYSQKNRWSIFPVAPPFPTLKPSRYRIHRQACRRGGTGAGCEGETQNLTVRVRENGLPPGLATIAPCACHRWSALDVPVRHTRPSRRLEDGLQRDRSSGINRRTGRWKAPYYFTLSRCFAAPRPSAVQCMVETRAERSRGVLVCLPERFCRVIPPSALPGISPSRGEIGKWPALCTKSMLERAAAPSRSPHLRGRCPAGQRGVFHSTTPTGAESGATTPP